MQVEDSIEIDEADRRWSDFQGGRAIMLPDGQPWWFYEPVATRRTTATVAGEVSTSVTWCFGPDTPRAVERDLSAKFNDLLRRWAQARGDEERAAAMLSCAWFLLARNYNIAPEEFGAIVEGATAIDTDRQEALGASLLALIGDACARSNILQGVA